MHVLPLLFPLLIASQLNVQQFAKHMFFVKDILRYSQLLALWVFVVVIYVIANLIAWMFWQEN